MPSGSDGRRGPNVSVKRHARDLAEEIGAKPARPRLAIKLRGKRGWGEGGRGGSRIGHEQKQFAASMLTSLALGRNRPGATGSCKWAGRARMIPAQNVTGANAFSGEGGGRMMLITVPGPLPATERVPPL